MTRRRTRTAIGPPEVASTPGGRRRTARSAVRGRRRSGRRCGPRLCSRHLLPAPGSPRSHLNPAAAPTPPSIPSPPPPRFFPVSLISPPNHIGWMFALLLTVVCCASVCLGMSSPSEVQPRPGWRKPCTECTRNVTECNSVSTSVHKCPQVAKGK